MRRQPILALERGRDIHGLWTTQKYGDFAQGDKRLASSFVTGRVEMRQLRGLFKLTIYDLAVVRRHVDRDNAASPLLAKVFLTKKKAKKRMADLEETSYNVPISSDVDAIGFVCQGENSLGTFDLSLKDAPDDPLLYHGLCIAKSARDPPVTEEPTIYGYVRFIDDRPGISTTESALGLHENKDLMGKTHKGGESTYKPIQVYARKAWKELGLVEEQQINFDEFKRALDLLDITLLEPRAMRLFEATDLDQSECIGIIEFQVALMMNDGVSDVGLTASDAFHMFDLERTGRMTKTAFSRVIGALGAGHSLPGKTEDSEERKAAIESLFDRIDREKRGEISQDEFTRAWIRLVDVDAELIKRQKVPCNIPKFLQMPISLTLTKTARDMINRASLSALCAEEATEEKLSFQRARDHVDRLRVAARTRRDERRRARKAAQERLSLSAARDSALRSKDRAARLGREQRLRNRQRVEEKMMRNRLAAEQVAAKSRQDAALKAERITRELSRVQALRTSGADRLDCSKKGFQRLPSKLYVGRKAQEALADLVMMDVGENRLESLPSGFLMWFASLRFLRLSANRLTRLPADEFGKMGHLEVLEMDGNNLETIPPSVGDLRALRELNISNNSIRNIPNTIKNVFSIERIDASSNHISSLPNLSTLQLLRDLQLKGNQLYELPESLPNLVSLTRLDIHNNYIHKLPPLIGHLSKLRILNLSSNRIVTFPDSSSGLTTCEVFLLQGNELVSLGHWIGGWKCAVFIDATDNKIMHVDRAVGCLRNLTELRLKRNCIEVLPPEIGLAQAMEIFDISANILQELPVELGALALLHTLKLNQNSLSGALPEQIGLLRSITTLNLSRNRISSLPNTIGGMEELVTLKISHNRLSTVPEALVECSQLRELHLSSNCIKELPMHLGKCTSLCVLDVQSNVIVEIPSNFACLVNLKEVFLGKNLLRALPLDIETLCKTVNKFHLDRNPFSDFPPRWAKFIGQSAYERSLWPSGYDDAMALAWVKDHATFYWTAVAEWESTGPLHVCGRSNLAAYEAAVKQCCGPAWQPHLHALVRTFYFHSRRTGNCPKFNRLVGTELRYRARTRQRADALLDTRYQRAHSAATEYEVVLREVYSGNCYLRGDKAELLNTLRTYRKSVEGSKRRAALASIVPGYSHRVRSLRSTQSMESETKREERLELEALHQHLWESCGRPSNGTQFFPQHR